ncbi:MAG: response regulator [Kofleriaceae bacterium]|nr:response regulator [Myxococcales bacterium]MCB9563464.1 response regulator [Kofleriaceae bacterium]MCB9573014.1 response regulator [Kofleriaceae bacterium]
MPRVLVVDDDPVAVRRIQDLLRGEGAFETVGATSVAEAVERAAGAEVALVGLRVAGPGVDDGLALIAALQRTDPLLEAVVTTSAADVDGSERARAAVGPVRHVLRSVEADELAPRVHALAERRRLRRQIADLEGQLATRDQALVAERSQLQRASAELAATHGSLATATERLVHAEQLAAVGRVVTGIAHELTEQLALINYAEALKSKVARDPELVELADVIVRAQKRLAAMVDEIRDFAAAGDDRRGLSRQPSDLAAVVDEALAIIGYDRDVRRRRLVRQWQARPIVELDHDKFSQVVVNLVSNAALATRPGDEVTLRIDVDDDRARLVVVDRGVGMPPEVLARLGEPFFTTRGDRGSGLGVGICMRIVEGHGGTLRFTSAEGEGTTATVTLPLITAEGGI